MKTKSGNNYTIIDMEESEKRKQYLWFDTFYDPTYGFNVVMDIDKVYKLTKSRNESIFINLLYLVTLGLNSVDEMRIRYVGKEVRLYETINPTYTVLNKKGIYENSGIIMSNDYRTFYTRVSETIEKIKNSYYVKDSYNDSHDFDEYYITCVPWVNFTSMTHPIPLANQESCTVPRVAWGKFYVDPVDKRMKVTLNITVSHAFVDGQSLSKAFNNIQDNLNNCEELLK